jgi:predicted DNA-binding transcriptional regulator YafY
VNIRRHLMVGRDSAVTLGELADALRVSRRQVEQAIHDARLAGVPIVTGSEGAWLATTAQEAREAASRLRDRAIHQLATAQALERAADGMESVGLTLWDRAA